MHALLHSAIHEVNVGFRTSRITSMTYGLRPLTSDHKPLIGATGHDGVHIATGTYRNGILMAPLIADLITAELRSAGRHQTIRTIRWRPGAEAPAMPTTRSSKEYGI
ncbi:hypothetical protein GCM10029963_24400 [Micromonospora andamanensis]